MNKADAFVHLVGRMPFTGRRPVRWYYAEGTRAAQRGNASRHAFCARRIGQIAGANELMAVTGAVTSAVTIAYGAASHDVLEFSPTAAGAALYAIGHLAAGVAEHIMQRRLRQQPVAEAPISTPTPEVTYPSPPTTWERIVTNAGTVAAVLPVAHIALHEFMS